MSSTGTPLVGIGALPAATAVNDADLLLVGQDDFGVGQFTLRSAPRSLVLGAQANVGSLLIMPTGSTTPISLSNLAAMVLALQAAATGGPGGASTVTGGGGGIGDMGIGDGGIGNNASSPLSTGAIGDMGVGDGAIGG